MFSEVIKSQIGGVLRHDGVTLGNKVSNHSPLGYVGIPEFFLTTYQYRFDSVILNSYTIVLVYHVSQLLFSNVSYKYHDVYKVIATL